MNENRTAGVVLGNIDNRDKPTLLMSVSRYCVATRLQAGQAMILECDARGNISAVVAATDEIHGLRDMLGRQAATRVFQFLALGPRTGPPTLGDVASIFSAVGAAAPRPEHIIAVSMAHEILHDLWALKMLAIEQERLDVINARCAAVVMANIGKAAPSTDTLTELRALSDAWVQFNVFLQRTAWPPPHGSGICPCGRC